MFGSYFEIRSIFESEFFERMMTLPVVAASRQGHDDTPRDSIEADMTSRSTSTVISIVHEIVDSNGC